MISNHEIFNCINCGEELEIFTYDIELGYKECEYCGYENDLDDNRIDSWEEEW
jgi:DNA-directed RNA polymerase subunit RPC12/RpoP